MDSSNRRTEVYSKLPRIELRQLRYFLAVAEEMNFTRAAEKMGIAQPPLSQQILTLEQQLKVQLFKRSRRSISLTPEGEAFIVYARRIINNTQIAAELVQAIERGEEGPLTIGAIFSSIYTLIPPLFEIFAKRHPQVRLHLREMTIGQQIEGLREDRIDLGILRGPMVDPELDVLTMMEEPFVVVVSKTHPLAERTEVSVADVVTEPLIRVIPSVNRNYSRQMFSVLYDLGIPLNIVHEVADTHTLLGLVAAGLGMSMVPRSLSTIHTGQLRYLPLKETTPTTLLQLAWHKNSESRTLPKFLQIAREFITAPPPIL
ncbi:LysR family transcriptional regulator [Acuticoccus mangrovi]|uniref:LysR family transcriptional regulator n=1 Tax=Acuticoccus mangrovi TaxID=2796142 RepID=A0A934MFV5_9HYPH|nr:LysR substrate-binding domain-containing protein [Acuticoccus mangrovi]MBJ3775330.1 LysR family transcriptional regulator [Acuticoccus mangrovi]